MYAGTGSCLTFELPAQKLISRETQSCFRQAAVNELLLLGVEAEQHFVPRAEHVPVTGTSEQFGCGPVGFQHTAREYRTGAESQRDGPEGCG